jgi:hypothetical protein
VNKNVAISTRCTAPSRALVRPVLREIVQTSSDKIRNLMPAGADARMNLIHMEQALSRWSAQAGPPNNFANHDVDFRN